MNQLICKDNLIALQELIDKGYSETVDLCYIDPPFFTQRDYGAYNDKWQSMEVYIDWLYKRVELIYKLLKPTGSMYLHCDWHADAYIRVGILDKVFGMNNFRNEIVWCYSTYFGKIANKKEFPRKHDNILFYSKSNKYFFAPLEFNENYYDTVDFKRWKQYYQDDNKIYEGKHPKNDSRFLAYRNKWIRDNKREPQQGELLYECKGEVLCDIWDIKAVDPKAKERIGYPTQKPEALLERIIKASSNEGDVVLDAFVGGGTTIAVANKLNRKWIGIDQSVQAIAVCQARIDKQDKTNQ